MTLKQRLSDDLKDAMRAGDGLRRDVLRSLLTAISNSEIARVNIKDESASHRYSFPSGFTLGPGATVRLHTGCGSDTDTALYWCNQGSAVWNNSGDTVFVLDPSGNVVISESYSG